MTSLPQRVTVACAQCGARVTRAPWAMRGRARIFCDRACRGSWERAERTRQAATICARPGCGQPTKRRRPHCSRACFGAGRRNEHPLILRCRRCGAERPIRPSVLNPGDPRRAIKSLKQTAAGWEYLCNRCNGRDRAPIARARLLAKHGITDQAGAGARDAMRDLLTDAIQRGGGKSAIEAKRREAHKQGLTPEAKRTATLRRLAATHGGKGELRLCRVCRKLIYLHPSQVQCHALGVHGPCLMAWRRGPEYRKWGKQIGSPRSPARVLKMRRYPRPVPPKPRGRNPAPVELARHFRWLVLRGGVGMSWRAIAEADGFGVTTVREGVAALVAKLPDSWRDVFPHASPAEFLDNVLPVERLRASAGAS